MAGAARRRFSEIGPGLAQIKLKTWIIQSAGICANPQRSAFLNSRQFDSGRDSRILRSGYQKSHFAPPTTLVLHVATAHGLSTPVRLIAVTTTLSGVEPVNRCDRSQPGSTSLVHEPPRDERTPHRHTVSPFIGAKCTLASFVAASRFVAIVGRLGAFEPSHGDAGTSAGFA